jgi:hypothetical protein
MSLPSVICRHSAKNVFAGYLFLILDKVYLFFFFLPPFFCGVFLQSLWTYMFNFGTFVKVFAIPIRFSSFT